MKKITDYKSYEVIPLEDCRRFELEGMLNPTRKVTLIDGSCVYIDRVTGITCDLEEQINKKEELLEKYRKYLRTQYQLQDLKLNEENVNE